jgi:DNA-binding SARP family transcriptional activator
VAADMEFCLLGPLVVRRDGAIVPVTARRQRAVLAALVLNAGRVVGPDELAEALWGAVPPRTARVSLQNYVMRLRNALGGAGRARIRTSVHATVRKAIWGCRQFPARPT